jgi:CheY-like chemotaxis protein
MTTHNILVVDDDLDTVANVSDILTDVGYDVDTACDGESALQRVRNKHYDLALLDFKMPDMDGLRLYEQIKSIQPNVAAIMITAHADNRDIRRAKDSGTWRVLRKPIDVDQLMRYLDGGREFQQGI